MQLSDISRVVEPTISRHLYMLAKQYDDVIDFTLGDPDLPTPSAICAAANQAAIEGKTRYSPNAGIFELREEIAEYTTNETGIDYKAENVCITAGATEAFYLSLKSILNEGDEVIILAPFWVQYENICKLLKVKPVVVDTFVEGFTPDILAIQSLITRRTKALIINSPNNPTGYIYDDELLKNITSLAVENDMYIVADEVYKTLIYQEQYTSISKYCPRENLLLFNSFSKQFAMTGWRVGYVLAEKSIIDTIIKLQQNIVVCVSTLSQYAALEAIRHAKTYSESLKDIFAKRRDILMQELSACHKIRCVAPQGTFYAFVDISETCLGSMDFCYRLLEKQHVATIPGVAFGKSFDNYIRLAFTVNEERIHEGVGRVRCFLNTL